MKAIVKVRIAITLLSEEGDPPSTGEDLKHDLVHTFNGGFRTTGKTDASAFLALVVRNINPWLATRCAPLQGDHKPDLALARGGDPEPRPLIDGDTPKFPEN